MKSITHTEARSGLTAADELKQLRQQVDAWRACKPYSGAQMPQNLWQQAIKAASKYGVSEVSRALNLGYSHLKSHCQKPQRVNAQGTALNFVELFTTQSTAYPTLPQQGQCSVELDNGRGAKMVVHLSADTVPTCLAALSAEFWRAS